MRYQLTLNGLQIRAFEAAHDPEHIEMIEREALAVIHKNFRDCKEVNYIRMQVGDLLQFVITTEKA